MQQALVVGGYKSLRQLYTAYLAQLGWEVNAASTYPYAAVLLDQDIVFDVLLLGLDGHTEEWGEFIDLCRGVYTDIPLIVTDIASIDSNKIRNDLQKDGITALHDPASTKELRGLLARL